MRGLQCVRVCVCVQLIGHSLNYLDKAGHVALCQSSARLADGRLAAEETAERNILFFLKLPELLTHTDSL